jgi:hypothetical protein
MLGTSHHLSRFLAAIRAFAVFLPSLTTVSRPLSNAAVRIITAGHSAGLGRSRSRGSQGMRPVELVAARSTSMPSCFVAPASRDLRRLQESTFSQVNLHTSRSDVPEPLQGATQKLGRRPRPLVAQDALRRPPDQRQRLARHRRPSVVSVFAFDPGDTRSIT